MADYTSDGRRLTKVSSGQKLAEVDRDTLRSYNGAIFGQIEGKNLRDSHGKKVAEFNGKEIKDDRGTKVIGIKEIQDIIEGEAGDGHGRHVVFLREGTEGSRRGALMAHV